MTVRLSLVVPIGLFYLGILGGTLVIGLVDAPSTYAGLTAHRVIWMNCRFEGGNVVRMLES